MGRVGVQYWFAVEIGRAKVHSNIEQGHVLSTKVVSLPLGCGLLGSYLLFEVDQNQPDCSRN